MRAAQGQRLAPPWPSLPPQTVLGPGHGVPTRLRRHRACTHPRRYGAELRRSLPGRGGRLQLTRRPALRLWSPLSNPASMPAGQSMMWTRLPRDTPTKARRVHPSLHDRGALPAPALLWRPQSRKRRPRSLASSSERLGRVLPRWSSGWSLGCSGGSAGSAGMVAAGTFSRSRCSRSRCSRSRCSERACEFRGEQRQLPDCLFARKRDE